MTQRYRSYSKHLDSLSLVIPSASSEGWFTRRRKRKRKRKRKRECKRKHSKRYACAFEHPKIAPVVQTTIHTCKMKTAQAQRDRKISISCSCEPTCRLQQSMKIMCLASPVIVGVRRETNRFLPVYTLFTLVRMTHRTQALIRTVQQ